jgi:hypothetical protein
MATPKWQAAKLYLPGAIVQPIAGSPPPLPALANGGFESGDTIWIKPSGWAITNSGPAYEGSWYGLYTGTGQASLEYPNVAVTPGQTISAQAYFRVANVGDGGAVLLSWLDSGLNEIVNNAGNIVRAAGYTLSSVTGTAPANAAWVNLGVSANRTIGALVAVDNVQWAHVSGGAPAGLVYKAVQAAAGVSNTSEPVWPLTPGATVVDGGVTWQAILATRVEWEASPILKSGVTEPASWPTAVGGSVSDGTISWEAISRRVEDDKCPNSKVVAIMASKIFAADKDIVRYSATANPLVWSSADDAGYLATGLQQSNANSMAVLAPYRGNLVAMNASCLQNWQVDPDPEAMALLDQMEGIGSNWQKAAQPVANDLLYLSQLGVRSVSIAAGAQSIAAGDIGMPIDPLVQAAISDAVSNNKSPIATYYPSQGQYWLAFPRYPTGAETTVFVCTMNGGSPKWSRYLFPFVIAAFAQREDDLYIRTGDNVLRVSESALTDYLAAAIEGAVWWPYLDCGQAGVSKRLHGFDIVASGEPSISIGYDQNNINAFTPPYQVSPDTLPGGVIPMSVTAPTFSIKVEFAPGVAWTLSSVQLYLSDNRRAV